MKNIFKIRKPKPVGGKRVGNFIISEEETHIKIQDIQGVFSHRVSKIVPIGMFLKQSLDKLSDEKVAAGLHAYITVLWNVSCCIPDNDYLVTINEAAKTCLERHPEAYGVKSPEGQTKEDDEQALQAIKEDEQVRKEIIEKVADEKPAPKKKSRKKNATDN